MWIFHWKALSFNEKSTLRFLSISSIKYIPLNINFYSPLWQGGVFQRADISVLAFSNQYSCPKFSHSGMVFYKVNLHLMC